MGEKKRRVREVTGVGEGAEGKELADGEIVAVETVGDEDGVGCFELAHVAAAFCNGHEPMP